jgi:hypothetical protein
MAEWRDHLTAREVKEYDGHKRMADVYTQAASCETQAARKIYDRARKRAAKEKPNAD